jgi:hypothetical protein
LTNRVKFIILILEREAKTMKGSNAALKKMVITDTEIQSILAMRESLDSMKKRYELLEDSVIASEQDVIAKLEAGAEVLTDKELIVRTLERRYPSWKSYYVELAGAEAAERVLAETTPTIYKALIVKAA